VAHPSTPVGNATCISDPAGTYTPAAGSIAYISAAPVGWYAAEPRATAQTLCAPGSYHDGVGTVSSGTPLLRWRRVLSLTLTQGSFNGRAGQTSADWYAEVFG
jgi:hypothetical protein